MQTDTTDFSAVQQSPNEEGADETSERRARRRLIGALVLSLFAAAVLVFAWRNPSGLQKSPAFNVLRAPSRLPLLPEEIAVPPWQNSLPAPLRDEDASKQQDVAKPAGGPLPEKPQAGNTTNVVPDQPSLVQASSAPSGHVPVPTKSPPPQERKLPTSRQFFLHVGTYLTSSRARARAQEITRSGIRSVHVDTVQMPEGVRSRVRVGPFLSRAKADITRSQLKLVDIDTKVVLDVVRQPVSAH